MSQSTSRDAVKPNEDARSVQQALRAARDAEKAALRQTVENELPAHLFGIDGGGGNANATTDNAEEEGDSEEDLEINGPDGGEGGGGGELALSVLTASQPLTFNSDAGRPRKKQKMNSVTCKRCTNSGKDCTYTRPGAKSKACDYCCRLKKPCQEPDAPGGEMSTQGSERA